MNQGKLIVIEGIDGVGKNTQAKLLAANIACVAPVRLFSFPQYDTPTGKEVAAYLNGEKGELSRFEISKLYAEDRAAALDEILNCLESGVHVVCDRYVLSNIAFQSSWYLSRSDAGDKELQLAESIIDQIYMLEYGENEMPKPDLTLCLILPVEVTTERVLGKAKRDYTEAAQDLHEADMKLQMTTAAFYTNAFDMGFEEPIEPIVCWDSDTETQLSPEAIQNKIIFPHVSNLIPSLRRDR